MILLLMSLSNDMAKEMAKALRKYTKREEGKTRGWNGEGNDNWNLELC